jgi:hypothetical protein
MKAKRAAVILLKYRLCISFSPNNYLNKFRPFNHRNSDNSMTLSFPPGGTDLDSEVLK